jgi:FKBP-type peptidyl-prolyl cis-trans isomerase 2
MRLIVVEFDNDNVTLDANHPLAGKTLTFDLRLVGFVGA